MAQERSQEDHWGYKSGTKKCNDNVIFELCVNKVIRIHLVVNKQFVSVPNYIAICVLEIFWPGVATPKIAPIVWLHI